MHYDKVNFLSIQKKKEICSPRSFWTQCEELQKETESSVTYESFSYMKEVLRIMNIYFCLSPRGKIC